MKNCPLGHHDPPVTTRTRGSQAWKQRCRELVISLSVMEQLSVWGRKEEGEAGGWPIREGLSAL